MTDEQEVSSEDIIRVVRQVLEELAPDADPQDVEEFIETLRDNDTDEREVNIGAGFGQFCEGEEACNAAFARYAELIDAERIAPNPSPQPGTGA